MITLKVPFYFQEIIFPYICDFVGMDRNFVIELDGEFMTGGMYMMIRGRGGYGLMDLKPTA